MRRPGVALSQYPAYRNSHNCAAVPPNTMSRASVLGYSISSIGNRNAFRYPSRFAEGGKSLPHIRRSAANASTAISISGGTFSNGNRLSEGHRPRAELSQSWAPSRTRWDISTAPTPAGTPPLGSWCRSALVPRTPQRQPGVSMMMFRLGNSWTIPSNSGSAYCSQVPITLAVTPSSAHFRHSANGSSPGDLKSTVETQPVHSLVVQFGHPIRRIRLRVVHDGDHRENAREIASPLPRGSYCRTRRKNWVNTA